MATMAGGATALAAGRVMPVVTMVVLMVVMMVMMWVMVVVRHD